MPLIDMRDPEFQPEREAETAPRPLTAAGVFWAVLLALWAFGLSVAIVGALFWLTSVPARQ